MNILMCCSDLSYKGGMVSVVKGYLDYADKGDVDITFVPTHRDGSKATMAGFFARAFVRIVRMARRGEIDVAHLHVSERGSFVRKGLLLRVLRRLGVKTVLHHHGAEFEQYYAGASPRHKRFIERTMRLADVNIVLSNRLVGMVKDKVPEARVEVLYNAVAVPAENPYSPDNATDVMFLGRIGVRKGAYDLANVMAGLDPELPEEVKFLYCGDGEEEGIETIVDKYGLQHRVRHIGWVDGEAKKGFLADTMVNVLPSYNEGLPMTILETMARGIPNISTRIASIPEVITDGITGILIEPGDTEALSEAIRRIVADRGLRARLSEASYRLVRDKFSIDTAFARLASIYRSLLS